MTERSKNIRPLEEIEYETLVLGSNNPDEFNGGPWKSNIGQMQYLCFRETFPMDIVLGLKKTCNVYKVVIEVDEVLIPSQVEICIGMGSLDAPRNYRSAREAHFKKPIVMTFHKRERSNSRMDAKVAFTDSIGQYIWIIIHSPVQYSKNIDGRIGIDKIRILGYELSDIELKKMRKNKEEVVEERDEIVVTPIDIPITPPLVISKKPDRHSYDGDGMKMNNGGLASDPLSTIRVIRNVLKQKMENAKEAGQEIEATVCLRAIQRLDEYETIVEDLASKRSNALIHGDHQQAERLRLSMNDARDTVMRAIHVDLLLNRQELATIGVQSMWNTHP